MHFSAFFLALLPAAVRGLTLFPSFDCTPSSASITVGCVGECLPFGAAHSFQNNDVVIPTYVQTYETTNCSSPPTPFNFTAAPHSCVPAITGAFIGSYKCQLSPFE